MAWTSNVCPFIPFHSFIFRHGCRYRDFWRKNPKESLTREVSQRVLCILKVIEIFRCFTSCRNISWSKTSMEIQWENILWTRIFEVYLVEILLKDNSFFANTTLLNFGVFPTIFPSMIQLRAFRKAKVLVSMGPIFGRHQTGCKWPWVLPKIGGKTPKMGWFIIYIMVIPYWNGWSGIFRG